MLLVNTMHKNNVAHRLDEMYEYVVTCEAVDNTASVRYTWTVKQRTSCMLCNQCDLAAVQIYGNEISYEIRPSIPLRNAVRCGNTATNASFLPNRYCSEMIGITSFPPSDK